MDHRTPASLRAQWFQPKSSRVSRSTMLMVGTPIVFLVLWEAMSQLGIVRSILLPPPSAIAVGIADMFEDGYGGRSIWTHIFASLNRVTIAFTAAVICGVAIGLVRGRYQNMDAIFLVPSEIIRPIPPLSLIPLFILWFGIGEVSKILIIFYYVTIIVMTNTQAGVKSCQEEKVRAGLSLGATSRQIFWYVIFPAALPQIMTGLRVGMGAAFSILVASELLGGDRGLGFVIQDASTFFRTREVFVGIVIIGTLGLFFDRGLHRLSTKFVHWEGKG